MSDAVILLEGEYCHIVNKDNGQLELAEGPLRLTLVRFISEKLTQKKPPNKQLYKKPEKKITLKENQYTAITNPYDKEKKKCIMGEIEYRRGPCDFPLYPGESCSGVYQAKVLFKGEAAQIKVLSDFEDKKAGQRYLIYGPTLYFPNKYETLEKVINAIKISQSEAIYVRNTLTAKLKLVKGPISYIQAVDEELYEKTLSKMEFEALKDQGFKERYSFWAFTLQIQKNEVCCIIDYQTNKETYVFGPKSHILGPYEGVKCITISAGDPKQENRAKIAILRLGPDFMTDTFTIRTKDNAVLRIQLTYKWKFIIDESNLSTLFAGDFVGYSCQSLRSRIREVAARHDFEKFHTSSAQILREAVFKNYDLTITQNGKEQKIKLTGRFFKEFSLLIFELDVKSISPIDQEIMSLLDQSIKSSMNILCMKLHDNAQNEAEKERIESETEIEELRRNLIEIENANLAKETIEKAKIDGKAMIEKAKAERQAMELLEKSKLDMEIESIKATVALLKGSKGDKYLEYVKAKNLHKNVNSACIIPSDTKTLFLPGAQNIDYE